MWRRSLLSVLERKDPTLEPRNLLMVEIPSIERGIEASYIVREVGS